MGATSAQGGCVGMGWGAVGAGHAWALGWFLFSESVLGSLHTGCPERWDLSAPQEAHPDVSAWKRDAVLTPLKATQEKGRPGARRSVCTARPCPTEGSYQPWARAPSPGASHAGGRHPRLSLFQRDRILITYKPNGFVTINYSVSRSEKDKHYMISLSWGI